MKPNNIAVLISCFNRKETTIECLTYLYKIEKNIDVYLVDDNSPDKTAGAVKLTFPDVKLIIGDGNLFWNRGMFTAWSVAMKKNYDYYLWLNDDVQLFPNSIDELKECSAQKKNKAIIVGLIQEKITKEVIYGGRDKDKNLIKPNGKLNNIKNMNGNIVLVPKKVFKKLGNLDFKYAHDLGDVDYGYRAAKKNIGVFTTRCFIGYGEKNSISRLRKNKVNLASRLKWMYSPLGSNPFEQFYFRRKHYSFFNGFVYFFFIHFLNIIPDKLNTLLFKDKYK